MLNTAYEVAVPSYRRAIRCRESTLAYLRECDIDPKRITLFVASEEERDIYTKALVHGTYGRIVVGVPGMGAIRNFIQMHYAPGTRIIHCDDDIRGLFTSGGKGSTLTKLASLEQFVLDAFSQCEQRNVRLWGIYPVLNAYFMKQRATFDLRYIIGCFWGSVNSHDEVLTVSLDDKEDFERTIKCYLADGGVGRFEYVAPKTNFYNEPGGMQVERTDERVRKSAEVLVERYPYLCTLNLTKKSGHAEVRLRDSRLRATK